MKGLDELSEVKKTKLYAVKITTSDVSGSGGFRWFCILPFVLCVHLNLYMDDSMKEGRW